MERSSNWLLSKKALDVVLFIIWPLVRKPKCTRSKSEIDPILTLPDIYIGWVNSWKFWNLTECICGLVFNDKWWKCSQMVIKEKLFDPPSMAIRFFYISYIEHSKGLRFWQPCDKVVLLLVSFDYSASVLHPESSWVGPGQICNVDLTSLCTVPQKLWWQRGDPKSHHFFIPCD